MSLPRNPATTTATAGAARGSGVRLGPVTLRVADLPRSRAFYTEALGMCELTGTFDDDDGAAGPPLARTPTDGLERLVLGGPDGSALLVLIGDASAPRRDPRHTGLFHFALLVPSRLELARSLMRLVRARRPLTGASDHLVSEALYLDDPDGNGIEIYSDRPPELWPHGRDGGLEMATLPLDLEDLVGELGTEREVPATFAAGTRIGHVHLQVASLPEVEHFYGSALGLEVMVRYPGALFLAADGYHHHLGLNTWRSRGAAADHPGAIGLDHYILHAGSTDALAAVAARLEGAGYPVTPAGDGLRVSDPSANRLLLLA
ncbi:VOC family protein [Conexibacter sp. DBS9H8]|uniref:VOC family protein n=1 Tax=Conexibacter sp. DBS9H8 TaxID=2937801 RepID=UPI00200DA70B|nr:VOC family protein [Conexibacter sp. DBS9H8]